MLTPTGAAEADDAAAGVRLLGHLRTGDLDAVDAEIDARSRAEGAAESWRVPLWRGMRALLEGRFDECRRAGETAAARARRAQGGDVARAGAEVACAVQSFHLRVAQGRLAEAEGPLRALAGGLPAEQAVPLRASLAWLLGLLGRDSEARAELGRLAAGRFAVLAGPTGVAEPTPDVQAAERVAAMALLAELTAVLDQRADAAVLYTFLLPHRGRFAVAADGAACLGSVSRYLGLLAHALGRWDDALAHFEAALADNRRVGAPLLVAQTCQQWSALLRARGDDPDWDQALELLADAEVIYRRLGLDRAADEARAVLARSAEVDAEWETPGPTTGPLHPNGFNRDGDEWVVRYGGQVVRLGPARGLADLACLVANRGQSVHVADLALGHSSAAATDVALGRAGQGPPLNAHGAQRVSALSRPLDAQTAEEYRARVAQLDEELGRAVAAGDRVGAAVARAERDMLMADLTGAEGGEGVPDVVELARRATATRIRLAIDAIEDRHPALGRHLRHSVRIGTFCSYEPFVAPPWRV